MPACLEQHHSVAKDNVLNILGFIPKLIYDPGCVNKTGYSKVTVSPLL